WMMKMILTINKKQLYSSAKKLNEQLMGDISNRRLDTRSLLFCTQIPSGDISWPSW
ncbi:hypothetical protein L9F63_010047, partial [Diploptera punctata]